MDEKQLQLLWDSHAKNGGFASFNEFKSLMGDSAARKVYFDDANTKLGFKDYDEFETILQVKKKEPSLSVSKTGSLVGGVAGSGAGLSEKEKLNNYLYGLKTDEEKQLASPTDGITTTLKSKPKNTDAKAQAKLSDIMFEDSDRWKDPVKAIVDESKTVEKFEDLDVYNRAAELTRSSLAGSGFAAKNILNNTYLGRELDNMTSKMVKNRADQYDKVAEPFRELGEVNYTDQQNFGERWRVYDAAIKAYANKNPQAKAQMEAAGVDLVNGKDLLLKLGDKTGFVINDILNDADFIDYVQNENPSLYNSIKLVSDNLLTDNKAFGVNVVANEISRERQKLGLTNPIVEFDDKQFRNENDLVAESLYRDNPQKMQLYNEVIKQDPDKYIDTLNFLESFAHGAEGVYKGMFNTVSAPFQSVSDQIKKGWEKEASHVTADPKGLSKFLSGTGHVLGLVSALGGITNVAAGGGAAFYSSKVAPALAGTVPFAGDFWHEGVMKYPKSPVKAGLSAGLNTILYGALSQRIFPAKQVQEAFAKVKPNVANIVENLTSGKITREAAKREATTLLKQALELVGGGVKKSAKISAELTAITAASRSLDKLMMDEETFAEYHPEDELPESFGALFLDNLVLGGMTKYSSMRKGNKIVEESLYEAATNPLRYKRVIDEMEIKDPSISKESMLKNLDALVSLKKDLTDWKIDEKNQKRYLFEEAKARAIKEQKTSEDVISKKNNETLKESEEIKEGILQAKDADEIVTTSEQKEIDEKNKQQADRNKLTEKGQKAIDKLLEEKDENDKNVFKGVYREVAKNDPEGFLQEIADQVFGTERIEGQRVKSKSAVPDIEKQMVKQYGADIVNVAKELFPLEPEKQKIEQPEAAAQQPAVSETEKDYKGQHILAEHKTTADKLSDGGTGFEWAEVKNDHDLSDKATKESYLVLKNIKDTPDAEVTIYRSVPEGVNKINEGDWITLSKTYAKEHGMHETDATKDLPVISMKVKAKDIVWDGNDLNEFAYKPQPSTQTRETPKSVLPETNPFKSSRVQNIVYRASTGGRFGSKAGVIFFTENKKYAESYAEDLEGNKTGEVTEHYVDLRNPLEVSMQKDYAALASGALIERAKRDGYDGIIAKDETGGVNEIVVFDKSQVISIAEKSQSAGATPKSVLDGKPEIKNETIQATPESPQPIPSKETVTPKTATDFKAEKTKLTEERDERITKDGKPNVILGLLPEVQVEKLKAKDRATHDDIEDRANILRKLIECLWKTKK